MYRQLFVHEALERKYVIWVVDKGHGPAFPEGGVEWANTSEKL